MSSKFVSGGTNEQPIERDAEWLKAQQAIDSARRERQEIGKQNNGKSLYETLQQNKAAKQEAFEESIKLKNQFKSLDEDEVDFLDSVLESERAKEDAIRKENREQLDHFRQQREATDRATRGEDEGSPTTGGQISPTQDNSWTVTGKKRRRGQEKELLKGVKLRKASFAEDGSKPTLGTDLQESERLIMTQKNKPQDKKTTSADKPDSLLDQPKAAAVDSAIPATAKKSAGLGLGAYDSESD